VGVIVVLKIDAPDEIGGGEASVLEVHSETAESLSEK
jgi:hypothetical protein